MKPNRPLVSNPTRWKAGVSGNPNGRPIGTRQAFSAAFYRDLAEVWAAHGKDAMLNAAKLCRHVFRHSQPAHSAARRRGLAGEFTRQPLGNHARELRQAIP